MKLLRDFPDPTGSAGYYWVQSGHRQTAIALAIGALQDLPEEDDPLLRAMPMVPWTIEVLLEGAYLRAYHQWETDTKEYFSHMRLRNDATPANWRGRQPHVEKVKLELAQYDLPIPPNLDALDLARLLVNSLKHDGSVYPSAEDYRTLVEAVDAFWEALNEAETTVIKPDR